MVVGGWRQSAIDGGRGSGRDRPPRERAAVTRRSFLWPLAGAALLISCGYHVGGKADLVPKNIETIAVPTFANFSKRYTLADMLPKYIAREFITRTRFRIEDNPAEADAVLNGTIGSVLALPAAVDPTSGKATSVRVIVMLESLLGEFDPIYVAEPLPRDERPAFLS